MPITISKSVFIEIAHRFAGHPIEANNRVHGHSLKVTVTAERQGALIAGVVMDFSVFDVQVQTIANLLDHRYLCDVKGLGEPTLENVAEFLGKRMSVVAPLRTVSVRVERPSQGQAAEWVA